MKPAPAASLQRSLDSLLEADHESLRERFEQTLSALRAGAPEEAAALWVGFDRELQAHLEMEERYILPQLEIVAPAEAAALLAEHVELRRRVDRLGTGIELHLTHEQAIREFAETFAAHAVREKQVLHAFARDQLPDRKGSALRALLLDARRRFLAEREH